MNARSLLHFPTLGSRVLLEALLPDRAKQPGPRPLPPYTCTAEVKCHLALPPLLLSLDSWPASYSCLESEISAK